MKIKSIKFMVEKSIFQSLQGFVETDKGLLLKYKFEFVEGEDWDTLDDYIEQIKYDFENEFKEEPYCIGEENLFDMISKEDFEKYYMDCKTAMKK